VEDLDREGLHRVRQRRPNVYGMICSPITMGSVHAFHYAYDDSILLTEGCQSPVGYPGQRPYSSGTKPLCLTKPDRPQGLLDELTFCNVV
jgi:hypothetical protein